MYKKFQQFNILNEIESYGPNSSLLHLDRKEREAIARGDIKGDKLDAMKDDISKHAFMAMRRASAHLMIQKPFFSVLLAELKMIERSGSAVKTMATDGHNLYYNPIFTSGLRHGEIMFVICHEIMHNAMQHFARQGIRNHMGWNIACDYAINPLINDIPGLEFPKDGLMDKKYFGMSAEEIYSILPRSKKSKETYPGSKEGDPPRGDEGWTDEEEEEKEEEEKDDNDKHKDRKKRNSENSENSGNDGEFKEPGGNWNMGETVKPGSLGDDAPSDEKIKDLQNKWKKNVSRAKDKHRQGKGKSALFDNWVKSLDKPKVNWKNELRKFFNQLSNEFKQKIPNRRFINRGMKIPGRKKIRVMDNVIIAVDTSGSIYMDPPTLAAFASEVKGIFESHNIPNVYVMDVDAAIVGPVRHYTNSADLKIKNALKFQGGGATAFKPAFRWVDNEIIKKGKSVGAFIYLTDGEVNTGGWPARPTYDKKVIWIIGNDHGNHIKIPFGKRIDIFTEVDTGRN